MPTPTSAPTAGLAQTGVPTDSELAQARADVSKLPLAKLAGQVVVARFPGTNGDSAAWLIRNLHVGGVAVMGNNIPSSAGMKAALFDVAVKSGAAMRADGRPWAPIIAIDQEGGSVQRLPLPVTQLPHAMAQGATNSSGLPQALATAAGRELRSLGLTMVTSPVADVTMGPADPTIGVRSLGTDPLRTGLIAAGIVKGYAAAGIVGTTKHFPGHGTVTTNSHLGLPVQTASLTTLLNRDIKPFQYAIAAGAPTIMVAHIVVNAVDPNRPASLSKAVMTDLLRTRLGFKGAIMTDALEMAAITKTYGPATSAVMALNGGADILLMPSDNIATVNGIISAVNTGKLSHARLVDAAARSLAMLRRSVFLPPAGTTLGSARPAAQALTNASITQITGRCGVRLVGSSVSLFGGSSTDRAYFTTAARYHGLRVGSGTSVVLTSAGRTGSGQVVVALDSPYGLGGSFASLGKFAIYSHTQQSFYSLVAALVGLRKATGRLPVTAGPYRWDTGCR